MAKQIYFEDVEVGTEIGPLEKNPTTQQLSDMPARRATSIKFITTRISRSATACPALSCTAR